MVRAVGAWMAAALFFGSAAHAQSLNFQVIGGGPVGDGAAPALANLSGAADVEYDAAGNLYVSQDTGNRIRRITPTGVVSTVVGGNFGFGGDGGAVSAAKTDRPGGIAIDTAGNLYFADQGNRRIRKVTPGGLITTVAGNGGALSNGDGGPAVNAGLAGVRGLAIDASNNLYIADPVSHVVRKVTPGGIITTVAGSGIPGFSGDNGAATSARLNQPYGVDIDAQGNLYIADTGNSAVRRVTPQGTITTVFAPVNSFPLSVAVDAAGAVYIGAYRECSLLKWNGSSLVRFAGRANACVADGDGGTALAAGMGAPDGIAFDAAGNLAFA